MNTVDFSYKVELKCFSTKLFKHTKMGYFKHTRVYQNEKNIVFISNPKYSSHSCFMDDLPAAQNISNSVDMKIYLKMEQGFSLIAKHDNYVDIFDFVGNQNQYDHVDFYNTYRSFIQGFIKNYLDVFNNTLANGKKIPSEAPTNIEDVKMNTTIKYQEDIFTRRELDCVKLLIAGNTAKTTAKKLNISPRTVERYLDNIKEKLGVRRKTEIISKVMQFVGVD